MKIHQCRPEKRGTRFISALVLSVLFFSTFPTASALSFSDVSDVNRNATAIEFLAKYNIISGYPDGTFQPDKPVSRVEFLKLALLSSQIELDVNTPSGFQDVDENAWYAPYLRKAKKEGWVQGYGDNTFKPTQNVNKVEGLKMIAEIQGWQIPSVYELPYKDTAVTQWYTPFVAYGKWHNFLEETGNYFIPSASLSRAKTSEILFRALVTKVTGSTNYSPDLITKVPAVLPGFTSTTTTTTSVTPVNFTPVSYQTQSRTYFDNITLDEDFPNTFYTNEFYTFQGKINSGTYDNAFVFVRNNIDETFENTSDTIKNGTFTIPVMFRTPGNYKLGVVPGNVGQSKYVEISVLASLPNSTSGGTSTVPANAQVQYSNQKTTFSWNNGTDNLAKVTVSQGSLTKSFFTRQNTKKFDVIYEDFQNFKPGQISYKIESAKASQVKPLVIDTPWVSGSSQTFTATEHTFSEIHKDQITYGTLPEMMSSPGNIVLSGKVLTNVTKEAFVIRPDGKVDTVDMQTSSPTLNKLGTIVISSGGNYSFNYHAASTGRYIVEINGEDGLAAINTPVYVGIGIPLIPDFFDFENASLPDENISTNILVSNLFKLINQERTKYGAGQITADATLNQLAQKHSDDMNARNFFGHINPDGKSPDDRRLAMGISTEVGENLAKAPNLLYAHNGLMRSAIHRSNILNPDWTRLGIGITKTSDGYLLVVEEFSTDVLDAAKLSSMKSSMYAEINQKRQSAGVAAAGKDTTLESVAENWSIAMATKKFFDFVAPDGSSLASNVQKAIPSRSVQMYILESTSQSQLLNQMYASTQVLSGSWKTIGIGLQSDNMGMLKLTLLLST